ncbi:ABC transporter substrate-binding protein [Rhodococcus erythropolis]|uniref:ABC transporter substrate-binding protein n=1 Tax=Rhodococcus erythropolis TaxID=1833 RepID=UPI0036DD9EA1
MKLTRRFAGFAALPAVAALLLTGCGSSDASPSTETRSADQSWSYTTGYGNTITLDHAPERIVVDAYSAAALWDYGIRPVGIFGYGVGNPDVTDHADESTMTVVGREGELSAEALAALDPDLVIGYGNSDDPTRWTWWDEPMGNTVNNVAPFVGVKFSGASTPDVLSEYAALAEALDGNTDTAAAREGKEAFESGAERIRTAAAKVDDIEVLALNGDSSELYAGTTALAQFGYLKELGVKFTGPGGDKGWADLSWEQVPDYPADIVFRSRSRQKHSQHHPCSSSCPR